MDIKVRSKTDKTLAKIHTKGAIKEIMINENFLVHNKESVSVCFKSNESSGVVTLSPKEIDIIVKALRRKRHMIKDVRIYTGDGI